jgi:hypothetical protein
LIVKPVLSVESSVTLYLWCVRGLGKDERAQLRACGDVPFPSSNTRTHGEGVGGGVREKREREKGGIISLRRRTLKRSGSDLWPSAPTPTGSTCHGSRWRLSTAATLLHHHWLCHPKSRRLHHLFSKRLPRTTPTLSAPVRSHGLCWQGVMVLARGRCWVGTACVVWSRSCLFSVGLLKRGLGRWK